MCWRMCGRMLSWRRWRTRASCAPLSAASTAAAGRRSRCAWAGGQGGREGMPHARQHAALLRRLPCSRAGHTSRAALPLPQVHAVAGPWRMESALRCRDTPELAQRPGRRWRARALSVAFRVTYVWVTVLIAIVCPFFGSISGLIGAIAFWPLQVSRWAGSGGARPTAHGWAGMLGRAGARGCERAGRPSPLHAQPASRGPRALRPVPPAPGHPRAARAVPRRCCCPP